MTERVALSIDNHVATVTLNRPDKHNALDRAMFDALSETGEALIADPTVRAVVLTAAGPNFCAGIDTSVFSAGPSAIDPHSLQPVEGSPANIFQRAAYVWREVPVPVICAITGIAYGGGLQVALGADLRYAAPDAQLSVMEVKWGIIPDMAITTTLTRHMAVDRIKELALTGRIVAGTEACELGLVTAVHDDPRQAAQETAAGIAARNPDAICAIKHLFDSAWQLADTDALELEAKLQLSVLGKPNQIEAVKANLEGRLPEFGTRGSAG